jgi:hypothetical protein
VLIAVAFMVFVYGIFQYFILGGASEEQRDKGKQFLLWGLIGFFIMFSVWGLVNILLGTFNFGSETIPPIPQFGGATQQATGGGGGGQQDLCANVNCPSYQHCDPTNGACIPNMFPYF